VGVADGVMQPRSVPEGSLDAGRRPRSTEGGPARAPCQHCGSRTVPRPPPSSTRSQCCSSTIADHLLVVVVGARERWTRPVAFPTGRTAQAMNGRAAGDDLVV